MAKKTPSIINHSIICFNYQYGETGDKIWQFCHFNRNVTDKSKAKSVFQKYKFVILNNRLLLPKEDRFKLVIKTVIDIKSEKNVLRNNNGILVEEYVIVVYCFAELFNPNDSQNKTINKNNQNEYDFDNEEQQNDFLIDETDLPF